MRDVAFRIRVRLENEECEPGFAGNVGNMIHNIMEAADREGILSSRAPISTAHFLSIELENPRPDDLLEEDTSKN